ncbi:flagellar protein FliT [Vibrio mexicanus]|uniref:flagellar protein FliT n=1 Tax=Vibrio mexicanus TaxID=1004326 RepID=UPI00063CDFDA|nr:flagellar protein FliT [Vibrio mexicanus]
MDQYLSEISEVDHEIRRVISSNDVNPEEIARLVDTREQILQKVISLINDNPELKQSERWKLAVQETKSLVELMQSRTIAIGSELKKYRHGNKSVQQYKKFL